ncbi:ABC transporter ATP-binding protein [Kribbella sandramycini]|uniref:ABC transporter ATP-binding protein n=1 Tax=Kribbella sandramycini TaxID=60450 RepID=A0A7Y4KV50_9ACTN|nr:ABC transporter ATP-binding protein [Kribbella sandramycini]MBB6568113.1 ABC-2 type transport system ATP-binding protein [Kribbella sandramycini]NOL39293.1 ABC transporter ATP-binding protein [Kribbella sandramycini]
METETAVRVRGLVKRYPDKVAVAGVDLDIYRGEVFALLGPNGAGKTTTTEILEGYRRADEGEIDVLGSDPGRAGREWRARIGIVAQTTRDEPELTVAELVRHFAGYYPSPRDPDEVIAAVGLEEKRKTRSRKLSGGQRRRLDVALGVIGNPELLFLDEPTTGFDPEARRQFWTLIENLRTAGTTILLTTHYLDEAEQLADRVGVIADGRMIEVATPETLGGRGARTARVSWLAADGMREVRTDTPTAEVSRLLAEYGGEVPELQVRRPSLEDIYLELIGSTPKELEGALR